MLQVVDMVYSYTDYNTVLENVNLDFEEGKLYAVLGQSGCGKTTLLSLLGGLDSPRKGEIRYNGTDIKEYGLDKHRQDNVAFIFQGYNLIEYMTAKENVELTARLSVEEALEKVGLERELWNRNVLKLSGGQQQRVAIARGIASNKPVLLADEPTGNLDEETARGILELLKRSAHQEGRCVIMVTHSSELAGEADVVCKFSDKHFVVEETDHEGEEAGHETEEAANEKA
ncbi:MAG: ATP-binding cassette domain-containing protein [Eubacteriales bacterium]|nr:ATP-binding cassette domain-containing protein [Eubacteriales bacterium]